MKFALPWLREFVETGETAADVAALARKLTSVGLPVETITEAAGVPVLDIEVFSNRPDCMNIYGVAREISAATGRALCPYPGDTPEDAGAPAASSLAGVEVAERGLCGRYTARVMQGVTIGPSPAWLCDRLVMVGLRPVNNIVDVTNYVLWELGHPLHAFDWNMLSGHRIVVRLARRGESLTTLDGVHRSLDTEMLVIADAERPVAIAGVMGGASTMVTEKTVDLLLESAHFDAAAVRRTSKRLALSTDASYRFERGADIEATEMALNRAAALIRQVAGGTICPGLLEDRPAARVVRRITLRAEKVSALLGLPVPESTIEQVLGALQFTVAYADGVHTVEVPSHRQDIEQEVDLVEEVGRSIGYDSIPERLPQIPGTGGVHRAGHRKECALREVLRAAGFSEATTSSFAESALDWGLRQPVSGDERAIGAIALSNPIAADQEILRTTLLPGLLKSVAHNLNHGNRDVRLFEIGRTFRRGTAPPPTHEERKHPPAGPVEEIPMLALVMTGGARESDWLEKGREASFHDMKGVLDSVLAGVGAELTLLPLDSCDALSAERALVSFSASGPGGARRPAGRLGALDSAWRDRLDIRQQVLVAEIDLAELYALPAPVIRFRPLPRFPAVSRDLSLVVPKNQPYRSMEEAIRACSPEMVAGVSVFDRYPGGELPPGTVGLSINIRYQHPERTLSAQEVADLQDRILATLATKYGAKLR